MCGPSSGLKAINKQIQDFSKQAMAQNSTIFGDDSQVFNSIMGAMDKIVKGGPSQQGFSAAELSARNAAAVQAGATEARNLKAAAASAAGAIGGGNVVTPSGTTAAAVLNAENIAASDTATAENAIQQENYATGRDNFFKSATIEEQAPSVFSTANQSGDVVNSANKTAFQSQQEVDQASNWAMNDITKLGTAAVGGFAQGAGMGLTGGAGKALSSAGNAFPQLNTAIDSETSSATQEQ